MAGGPRRRIVTAFAAGTLLTAAGCAARAVQGAPAPIPSTTSTTVPFLPSWTTRVDAPNPWAGFARRPGARAVDVELAPRATAHLGGAEMTLLAVAVTRTLPKTATATAGLSVGDTPVDAFAPVLPRDRRRYLRVDMSIRTVMFLTPAVAACTITRAHDGAMQAAVRADVVRRRDENALTAVVQVRQWFAVGPAHGPYFLACNGAPPLFPLGLDDGERRAVWRIDG